MRSLLLPLVLALMALAAAAVAIVVARMRARRRDAVEQGSARVLAAPGATSRCVEATAALRDVAAIGTAREVDALWASIAGPLEQAAPECPREFRDDLAQALDACARAADQPTAAQLRALRDRLSW